MMRNLSVAVAFGCVLSSSAVAQVDNSFPRDLPKVTLPAPSLRVAPPVEPGVQTLGVPDAAIATPRRTTASPTTTRRSAVPRATTGTAQRLARPAAPARAAAPAPQPDVTLRTVEVGPVALQTVVLPSWARVNVVAPVTRGKGDTGQTVLEIAADLRPDIVVSGGYLSAYVPPTALGLLRVDGEDISRPHTSWLVTGLFCTTAGRHSIRRYAPDAAEGQSDCLQSGPLLVEDGEALYPSADATANEQALVDQVVTHTFACITEPGRLTLGISGVARLDELAPALVEGLGCAQAMRLSGRETGGMYLHGIGLIENSDIALPSAITVHGVTVARPSAEAVGTGMFR